MSKMSKGDRIGIVFMMLSVLVAIIETGEWAGSTITTLAFVFGVGAVILVFQRESE